MGSQRILVIEDERQIVRLLELELQHEGYAVETAFDGIAGVTFAETDPPDLILLDIMLPGLNGLEVCRKIRKDSNVPIIMLTARAETPDKVVGLDMGATDYVTKPFVMEELLARVRAALRRNEGNAAAGNALFAGGLVVNRDARTAERDGRPIELTRHEFDLLAYLIINKGIVLSRDQILSNVWGYDFSGETKIVDVYIRYLRNKVDDGFGTKLIHTVRGVGYMLKENSADEA